MGMCVVVYSRMMHLLACIAKPHGHPVDESYIRTTVRLFVFAVRVFPAERRLFAIKLLVGEIYVVVFV